MAYMVLAYVSGLGLLLGYAAMLVGARAKAEKRQRAYPDN
jgi:hypothetical protein